MPAADKLKADLADIAFNAPQVPVINNVDVAKADDVEAIKDALVRQLYCPVRWTETIRQMAADGVEQALEFGPGKVLTGLVKRIDKSVKGAAVNTPAAVEDAVNN